MADGQRAGQSSEADFILFVANVQAASDGAPQPRGAPTATPTGMVPASRQLLPPTTQMMRPPTQPYPPTLPLPVSSSQHVLPPIQALPRPEPRKLAPHAGAGAALMSQQATPPPAPIPMMQVASMANHGFFNGLMPRPLHSVPQAAASIAANAYIPFAITKNLLPMPSAGESIDSPQAKRYRESHNEVERRRRESINQIIAELASMVPECYPGQSKGSILRKAADYIRRIQACGGSANASSQSPATVKMEPLEEAAEQAANSLSEAVSDESSIDSDAASVADVPSEVVTTPSPSADKRKAPSDENASASESVEETAALDSDLTRDSKRPRIEGESCPIEAKPAGYDWKRAHAWPTTDSVPLVPVHAVTASAVNVVPM